MITGFNTDVKHGIKVYHVQTEDKGRNNPKIETLVYVGGEILDNYRTSYEQSKADLSEEQIMEMLEGQHKRVIRTIKVGHYDEPTGFPAEVVTERPLDEVIVEYLATEPAPDYLKVVTNGVATLSKKRRGMLNFLAKRHESLTPVSGVQIRVKLLRADKRSKVIFKGETDKSGTLGTEINLSAVPPGEYTLMVQAMSEWGAYEQQFPLRGLGGPAVSSAHTQ